MIDLTPLDVRKKKGDFRKKPLGGYDTEEVDNFLVLVEDRLEELVRENLRLNDRLATVEARLVMLEGREEAVQEALVSAQELRKEVQSKAVKDAESLSDQSRREIELLRREADAEIKRRFVEAEYFLRERTQALEDLERNRRKFLKAFRNLLERELDAVEVEEARRPLEDAPLELEFRGGRGTGGDGSGEGTEEAEGAGSRYGQEPLWLSSLLKQEDGGTSTEPADSEALPGNPEEVGTAFLFEDPAGEALNGGSGEETEPGGGVEVGEGQGDQKEEKRT